MPADPDTAATAETDPNGKSVWVCVVCPAAMIGQGWSAVTCSHCGTPMHRGIGLALAKARETERQRIRQLAIDVNARYVTYELPNYTAGRQPVMHRFADLLESKDAG